MDRSCLALYLNQLLKIEHFQLKDYCPNGLQVQGKSEINKIATGVTASLEMLDKAIVWGADAILVHHGYFWKNEAAVIVGQKYKRLHKLLTSKTNLFAYHLPLDIHEDFGNNVQLANLLELNLTNERFGELNLGFMAELKCELNAEQFSNRIELILQRKPLMLGDSNKALKRIAICTGAAQGFFQAAIECGADAFITGEVSEQTLHTAVENDVVFYAAGHHATERYGTKALGEHIAAEFKLCHQFFDLPNPV